MLIVGFGKWKKGFLLQVLPQERGEVRVYLSTSLNLGYPWASFDQLKAVKVIW